MKISRSKIMPRILGLEEFEEKVEKIAEEEEAGDRWISSREKNNDQKREDVKTQWLVDMLRQIRDSEKDREQMRGKDGLN